MKITARRLQLRLSQVLGATKKGYAVDTFEGGFPVVQTMENIAAASASAVRAAYTLDATATDIATSITSPSHYRNLTVLGNQASVYGNVVITGRDWADRLIQETILASGTTSGVGNLPFKEVLNVNFPAKAAAGDTISIGTGEKLGLYRPVSAAADLVLTEKKASGATYFQEDTAGTLSTTYDTVDVNGSITGNDSFKFHYLTDVF